MYATEFPLQNILVNVSICQVAKHYYRFQNAEQKDVGTDVLALDILRGRDHGLQPYSKYLEKCTKTRIQSWDDFKRYINHEVRECIQFYNNQFDGIERQLH